MSQVTNLITPTSPLTMLQLKTFLDGCFAAIGSFNRGSVAPSNPFDGMAWLDTSVANTETLKVYNTSVGWMIVGSFITTTGIFIPSLNVGSDADGDIYYRSGGVLVRLAKGTAGQVLTMDGTGTAPVWTGTGLTVGAVVPFAVGTVPAGYLECDGALISTTTYSALFSHLGTIYGSGSGTFAIPDYRGKFLRGWTHGSTNDPDASTRTNRGDGQGGNYIGTNQPNQYYSHGHTGSASVWGSASGWSGVENSSHDHYVPTYSGIQNNANTISMAQVGYGPYQGELTGGQNQNHAHYVSIACSLGASVTINNSGGNETRPINIYVMWCIKY